jgi:hypothetical protein
MREFNIVKIRRLDAEHDLEDDLEILHQVDRFPRSAEDWRELRRPAGPVEFRRHLVGEVTGRSRGCSPSGVRYADLRPGEGRRAGGPEGR